MRTIDGKRIPDVGDLRHQVQLLPPIITPASTGELVKTWTRVAATVWASIEELSGRELEAAQRRVAEATVRIVIRYRRDVNEIWHIIWQGRTFEVEGPPIDLTSQREWLELLCVEVR